MAYSKNKWERFAENGPFMIKHTTYTSKYTNEDEQHREVSSVLSKILVQNTQSLNCEK